MKVVNPDTFQAEETAALEDEAKAFVALLCCMCFWYKNKLDSKKHKADLRKLVKEAIPFYVEFKFTKPLQASLNNLTEHMLAGKIPTDYDDEDMMNVGQFMSVKDKLFEKTTEIPTELLKDLRAAAQYMRNGSENAWTFLEKNIVRIVPFLAERTEFDVPDQTNAVLTCARLVAFFTGVPAKDHVAKGRNPLDMTKKERAIAAEKDPEKYQEFLNARRTIVQSYRLFLRNYVRSLPEKKVLYSEMLKVFKENQVFNLWPNNGDWDGYVDEEENLYTMEGAKIGGWPGPFHAIRANKNYDPDSEVKGDGSNAPFMATTAEGNEQYFYVVEKSKEWKKQTFEVVDEFFKVLPDVRHKWLQDVLAGPKLGKKYFLGVMCELFYWTSARIGSESGSTKDAMGQETKTFGLAVIRGKMVTKAAGALTISYLGKKKGKQVHVLQPKTKTDHIVADQVWKWAQEAGPNALVFSLNGDHETPLSGTTIKNYVISKGAPEKFTTHKFRHARATSIMMGLLHKCPFLRMSKGELVPNASNKPDSKQAAEWYEQAAVQVGAVLGHSSGEKVVGTTAIAAYIAPTITTKFFDDLNVRKPRWAQKFED